MNSRLGCVAVLAFLAGLEQARAATVYLQNFDSGTSDNQVTGYWNDPTGGNGFYTNAVTKSSGAAFGGIFGNGIISDESGTGYFLFEGTGGGSTSGTDMFQSPSFTVAQNTNYTISFYLDNEDSPNPASVQPQMNGQSLGSPVSATGTGTWQQFTFSWNSGSNTSATLILNDLQTSTTGNDFGVDVISVATSVTPEPSTTSLIGIGALAWLVWARRKSTICATGA